MKKQITKSLLLLVMLIGMASATFAQGTISGWVRNSALNPIIGATISAATYTSTTGAGGSYTMLGVPAGTYTVGCAAPGYNSSVVTNVVVTDGGTTTLNFTLTNPTMSITPNPFNVIVNPNEYYTENMYILNEGTGNLHWTGVINFPPDDDYNGSTASSAASLNGSTPANSLVPGSDNSPYTSDVTGTSDAIWNQEFYFNANAAAEYGVETDGNFIYTSTWNVSGTFNKYQKVGSAWTYVETFTIPGVGGIRDLAFDGTYFYGGANSTTIYKMDFTSKTLVGTISTTQTVRHIAFDPAADGGAGGFWVGAWNTLALVSRTGAVLTTTTAPLTAIAGSAYDNKSTGGPFLWLFNQTTGALGTIYQYKIATQSLTGITHNANDIPGFSGSAGGLATSLGLVPGKLVLLGSVQQSPNLIFCYELKTMPNWFTLDQYSGDVAGTTNYQLPAHFNAANLTAGTVKTCDAVFTSTPDVGTWTIPVSMTVQGTPLETPQNLVATLVDMLTGEVSLTWDAVSPTGLLNYIIKRDGVQIATTTTNAYTDMLPDYGTYSYIVLAVYSEGTGAPSAPAVVEWPNPILTLNPASLSATVWTNTSKEVNLTVGNDGEGTLAFSFPDFAGTGGGGGGLLTYCAATASTCDEFIGNVAFGSINNGSGCTYYTNYTNLQTEAFLGYTMPITVTNGGNAYTSDQVGIWIDFNHNGTFDGSEYTALTLQGGGSYFTGNITIPLTATQGLTTMRVRMAWAATPAACGTQTYGEVEDYAVEIKRLSYITSVLPFEGTVAGGETQNVEATFSATGTFAPAGTYNDNLVINSNDPAHTSVSIPCTMIVTVPGMISGVVTDGVTSELLQGVLVTAGSFTTMTNENGEYTLTCDANTYDVVFSKVGYQSATATGVVVTSGATTTVNAQLYEMPYAPACASAVVNATDTQCDVTWCVPMGPYELNYDDGTAENFAAWQLPGNLNAVKFTPVGYPATVVGGLFYVGDGSFPAGGNIIGSTFIARVFDDDGANGLPGTDLSGDGVLATVTAPGWVTVTGLNATIASGSFYLAMEQNTAEPDCAPIGVDESQPKAYQSYSKFVTAGGNWVLSAYQDFMIHAIVSGPVADDDAAVSTTVMVPAKASLAGVISQHVPFTVPGVEGAATLTSPEAYATDAVHHYKLVRFPVTDPNGPVYGTPVTLTSDITANSYVDGGTQWANLAQGWYAYGVKAVYPNGQESDYTYTNIVGHKMKADVTINVQLVCGFVPGTGAEVQMIGLDYPYETYTATVPASGTVTFNVWKGNYTVDVRYPGYTPFIVDYNITGPRTIDVILEDVKYAPRNLFVDANTLVANWEAPLLELVNESFEGASFPPSGWQNVSNGSGWFGTTNGGSSFFAIPAHTKYACVNDDANDEDNCCTYLITPAMNLSTAPGFVLNFDSYFTGAWGGTATVELTTDAGATWTTIYTVPAGASWSTKSIDLSAYSGPGGLSTAWIGFHYNDNGSWADGWAVDNVSITTGMNPTLGYGVFLDGSLVGNTNETTWTFNPSTINWGQTYVAGVAGLYCSGYSDQITYTFTSNFLFPPRNLQGVKNDNAAVLTWEPPLSGDYALAAAQPRTETPNTNAEYSPTYASGNGTYTDATWDILLTFPTDAAGKAGVSTDGSYIYTTIWSGGGFQKYDLSGNLIEEFNISGVNSIRDLAYNPNNGHFYGSPNSSTLYEMDFTNKVLVGSVSTGVAGIRHLAYDPTLDGGNGGFWAGGWADDYKIKMDGTVIGATTGFNLSAVYGSAYDDASDGGPYMWYFDQNGSGVDLYQYSIASNAFTGFVKAATDIPGFVSGSIAGGLDVSTTMVAGKAVMLGLIQQDLVFVYELSENVTPPPSTNLVSYVLYRDGNQIAEVPKTDLEYWDMNLDPATYCYEVTAKYDMTTFGFPGVFAQSLPEGPACVDVFFGYPLPFIEDWTAGTFDLNHWVAGENWIVDGQLGNPYPTAKFKWDPILNDYSSSLETWWIDGSSVTTTTPYKIWLDFDLALNDRTSSTNEKLNAEVWNGTSWKVVGEYANNGSFDWTTAHIDITNKAKDRVFKVRFNANGDASNDIFYWLVDNVHIYVEYLFNPPTVLVATPAAATGTIVNDIHLTWTAPEGGGGGSTHPPVWIHWDSGENSDGIGTGGAADFDIAARFDVSQLEEFDGMALTKVAFFPRETTCQYSIRVWVGEMAGTLVVDQLVASPVIGEWNEVDLETPVELDVTQELWFGVRCNATAGWPAGCDAGPQTPDYGQWIYWSGAWQNLVDLNAGLTYNWNLQGYLESLDDSPATLSPIVNNEVRNNSGTLAKANYAATANATFVPAETTQTDAPMDLTGYNVYRRQYIDPIPGTGYTTLSDWAKINTDVVVPTEYWDNNLENNCYDYYVTAVYTEGESAPSNIDAWNCIVVGVNNVEVTDVRVYPNPATSYVNIDLTKEIKSIAVYNALGSVVMQKNITGESTVILHTTNYAAGAYNVKFVKANGDTFSRKFVVVK